MFVCVYVRACVLAFVRSCVCHRFPLRVRRVRHSKARIKPIVSFRCIMQLSRIEPNGRTREKLVSWTLGTGTDDAA